MHTHTSIRYPSGMITKKWAEVRTTCPTCVGINNPPCIGQWLSNARYITYGTVRTSRTRCPWTGLLPMHCIYNSTQIDPMEFVRRIMLIYCHHGNLYILMEATYWMQKLGYLCNLADATRTWSEKLSWTDNNINIQLYSDWTQGHISNEARNSW